MNRIKKYILNIFYGLPFGLKSTDTEIMGGKPSDDLETNINQEVSDERVAKHLLKGEVTQEVEELRYRTYKVANESENYKYLGNGVAIKDEVNQNNDNEKKRFKFTQENENICESVLESFNQVGKYGVEKYRFEFEYKEFIRFKIEKYATMVDVFIDKNEGIIETVFHFNRNPNPYDAASMPFINELSKAYNSRDEHELSRNEIVNFIKSFAFSTYKALNENDFITYYFTDGKFVSITEEKHEYLLKMSWNEFIRIPLALEVKYFSKSMAEKYDKKERKNVVVSLTETERKRYCSVCGKEMSVYDADIQEASGQMIVCKECMAKNNLQNKN